MDDNNIPTGGFPPIYKCKKEEQTKKKSFSKNESMISISKIIVPKIH